jgi:hypothetical protein
MAWTEKHRKTRDAAIMAALDLAESMGVEPNQAEIARDVGCSWTTVRAVKTRREREKARPPSLGVVATIGPTGEERPALPVDKLNATQAALLIAEAQRIDREIDDEDTPAAVRQKLLQDSHVAWQRARAAAEAESRKTTRTLADMQRDAEELAASAPPAVAVALAAGLRRRGLVS